MLKIGNRMVDTQNEEFEEEEHEVGVDVIKTSDGGGAVALNITRSDETVNTISHLSPESARFLGIILIEAAFLAEQQISFDESNEEVRNDH